jgi:hypothetical protein
MLHAELKEQVPQHWMPSLWTENHRMYIRAEEKGRVVFPVEKEIEIVFGMGLGYPLQGFSGKPAYSVHLSRKEQTGVYTYSH